MYLFSRTKYSIGFFSLLFLFSCSFMEEQVSSFPTIDTLESLQFLPGQINESSGMFLDGGLIWNHNDSGDRPFLYAFSQGNRKLERKVLIANSKAKDWEAVTTDNQFVYIGDIGNNSGKRRDLTIYRVSLDSLRLDQKTVPFDGKIQFEYADQTFSKHQKSGNNFDCEAMIAMQDSLYLFSKNWGNGKTTVYRLPKKVGNHIARPVHSFDVEGLITSASYDKGSQQLCLLGYTLRNGIFSPFVWFFDDFPDRKWFEGKRQRFDLPVNTQMEALVFQDSTQLLITCERGSGSPGELYQLTVK